MSEVSVWFERVRLYDAERRSSWLDTNEREGLSTSYMDRLLDGTGLERFMLMTKSSRYEMLCKTSLL